MRKAKTVAAVRKVANRQAKSVPRWTGKALRDTTPRKRKGWNPVPKAMFPRQTPEEIAAEKRRRKPRVPSKRAVAASERWRKAALTARQYERPAVDETPKANEYVFVDLRVPKPVYNLLARAAKIAQMEHAQISLALIALAMAQREAAGQ